MIRVTLLLIVLFHLICVSCENNSINNTDRPHPNIVFILADDLGIGDIEVFNPQGKIPTPHLNKMANEGMIFTDAHTSSSVCSPTRYGLLTGRYNWRSPLKSGVLFGRDSALIAAQTTTVPTLLKKSGYHTAFIGKWHLGWDWALDTAGDINFTKPITESPNDRGFDYAYGHIASLDIPPYVYVENRFTTAVPDTMIPATRGYGFYRKGWIAPDFKMSLVTPQFFNKSREYIAEQSRAGQPFFLYLALPSPHTPILPNEEWQRKSNLNPYGDFVMEIDYYVGRLMDQLDSLGQSHNTMVVFTSDNGCSPMARFDILAEKGHNPSAGYRGHKADIFEGGHRVPTIVKYPDMITPGKVCDSTICLTDFYATFADITGISLLPAEGVDSYSLLPLLSDSVQHHFERSQTIHSSINGSFAIRQGKWKLNLCPGSGGWSYPTPKEAIKQNLAPIQLYNMATDPGETQNVYNQHPEKVQELYHILMKTISEGRSTAGSSQQNEPNGYGPEWTSLHKLQELEPFVLSLKDE